MKGEQLKLFEERINNAIAFIETLKTREKNLIQEKEGLLKRILGLESDVKERDNKIKELTGSQEFLKEKIESILGKLESFASIEIEEPLLAGDEEMPAVEQETDQEISEGNIIIEEDIVDLKEPEGEQEEEQKISNDDKYREIKKSQESSTEESENFLFDSSSDGVEKSGIEPERMGIGSSSRWLDNNPFIQT
jgi:hypothetical protein